MRTRPSRQQDPAGVGGVATAASLPRLARKAGEPIRIGKTIGPPQHATARLVFPSFAKLPA